MIYGHPLIFKIFKKIKKYFFCLRICLQKKTTRFKFLHLDNICNCFMFNVTLGIKIWRKLQKIGVVAVNQSAYVMPLNGQSQEDLSRTLEEIIDDVGDGSIFEAVLIEGLNDEQIIVLFRNARKADYEKIIQIAKLF